MSEFPEMIAYKAVCNETTMGYELNNNGLLFASHWGSRIAFYLEYHRHCELRPPSLKEKRDNPEISP